MLVIYIVSKVRPMDFFRWNHEPVTYFPPGLIFETMSRVRCVFFFLFLFFQRRKEADKDCETDRLSVTYRDRVPSGHGQKSLASGRARNSQSARAILKMVFPMEREYYGIDGSVVGYRKNICRNTREEGWKEKKGEERPAGGTGCTNVRYTERWAGKSRNSCWFCEKPFDRRR